MKCVCDEMISKLMPGDKAEWFCARHRGVSYERASFIDVKQTVDLSKLPTFKADPESIRGPVVTK